MRLYPVILASPLVASSPSPLADQLGLDSSLVDFLLQWSSALTLDEHPEDVSETASAALVHYSPVSTPLYIFFEALSNDLAVSDEGIMAQMMVDCPDANITDLQLSAYRRCIELIRRVPEWLFRHLDSYGMNFTSLDQQRLLLELLSHPSFTGGNIEYSSAILAQIIHVWGHYCIIPMRSLQSTPYPCVYKPGLGIGGGEFELTSSGMDRYLDDVLDLLRRTL